MSDPIISFSSKISKESKKSTKDDTSNEEIVSPTSQPGDTVSEVVSLRPDHFDAYVGQIDTVETLKIAIQAAKMRGDCPDHVLLHGPPGLGKTTIAHIIANEMGGGLTVTSGPALERGGI